MPVCSPSLFETYGTIDSITQFDRYPLLHSQDEPWDDWFDVIGGRPEQKRGPVFIDSLSIVFAAQQSLGLGLARWSLIAAELESGQLLRPIEISLKSPFAYYFVAPARYFELPKVVRFRAWLDECCSAFPTPDA